MLEAVRTAGANRAIVIFTPWVHLVEQLTGTLSESLPGQVGAYYGGAKVIDRPVVVACNASAIKALAKLERRIVLAITDETH